jgi:hypothetical protein
VYSRPVGGDLASAEHEAGVVDQHGDGGQRAEAAGQFPHLPLRRQVGDLH